MAFSKYTIIAEKFETLIETLETDTRAKDFYDIYKLVDDKLDSKKLYQAIYNTFQRRNTLGMLYDIEGRFNIIKESIALREYWNNYQRKHYYAQKIEYEDFIEKINIIIKTIENTQQAV